MNNFIDVGVTRSDTMEPCVLKIRPEIIIAYSNDSKLLCTTHGNFKLADDFVLSDELMEKAENHVSIINKFLNENLKR